MLKNPGPAHPSRPLKIVAGLARAALWLVLAAWALFALTWGALHGLIVPRVDQWRPTLEAVATRALGVRVQVGSIEATSSGAIPAFELRDVRLFDPGGREALHLPRVRSALSVRSLWRLGFEQLLIEGPVLEVRRTAQGRIEVAGIDVSAAPDRDSGPLADWFFSQTELAVRGGELRWIDDMRPGTAPLVLTNIDWVSRNPGRQHQWRLDATPPADWGNRLSLRGRFAQPLWQTRAGAWRDWRGTLYVEAPTLDLQPLRQYLSLPASLGGELRQGRGALRGWASVERGALADATLDLALQTVQWDWRQGAEPLALDGVRGRLHWQQQGAQRQWRTEGLAFTTADGLVWPGGDVTLSQTLAADGGLQAWEVQADRFDLGILPGLAPRLPLPAEWQALTAELQPAGQAEALTLAWGQPQGADGPRWHAQGRISGLHLAAAPAPAAVTQADGSLEHPLARPGLRGAVLSFEADQDGGRGALSLPNGELTFPGMFEDPTLRFAQLQTEVLWRRQGERYEVELPKLSFRNADAEGQGRVRWHTADPATSSAQSRFPGVLDLDVQMSRANGARVERYLPQGIPLSVRQYLQGAVPQGQARDARFTVQGDLWDFPFAKPGQGRFEVHAQLHDVSLAYVPAHLQPEGEPPWPALERVQAELHIDRVGLHIVNASGGVAGRPNLRAVKTDARIADFTADDPLLQVRGTVQGPGDEALDFVNRSPLGGLLDHVLARASLSGPVELGLGLDLPLNRVEAVRVNGQLALAGNDLRVTPDAPWLRATRGTLSFSEQGFRVPQATARLLGGELRFSGGMASKAGRREVSFDGQGTVTADGLRQAGDMGGEWAVLGTLGTRANGSTGYQVRLGFGAGGQQVLVTSGLQGLALNLPSPLGKSAPELLPLRYAVTPHASDARLDALELELGAGRVPLLSARYERQLGSEGVRVRRGALALRSERPPLPLGGVHAQLALGDVDVQAWEQLLDAVEAPTTVAPTTPPNASTPPASTALPADYLPTTFAVSAERLQHGGRQFHELVAGGSRDGSTWRLTAQAREFDGYLEYRPGDASGPGRVQARLARLTVPPAQTHDVEQWLQSPPTSVPALDVVVDDLELSGRHFGKLEIQAVNRQTDGMREWRLNTLNLTVPEARLRASGNWASLGGPSRPDAPRPRRTALKVQLAIDDAGALLARFGMPGVVRGGQGTLDGNLGWLGSPLVWDVPSLSGELQLDLQRGQFLKADPGLAKLLGVLSLQALPRRLTLDFRDVFSDGFAFDFARGLARIERGVASTNNLQMKGVTAAVLLEGQADIVRETQDITAVVVPELNAGTASLVATVINPITGLGSFLAQYLLRQPLQAAATQQYRITGSWADPQVVKLEGGKQRNIGSSTSEPASSGGKP